ncbi:MAG: hypothetical protein DWQ40_09635 [Actinobacteria bacterium]|nr:MAG: hypothetical protein DWQ40_09635 [Actinomycetota bacterium]
MRGEDRDTTTTDHIAVAALSSCAIVTAIVLTSIGDRSALGAPGYWAWVLTGLQVAALRTAATGRDWGWLLGASVQLPWIAYALVTAQFGFIPGCLISGFVQANGYLRRRTSLSHHDPIYA